MEEQKISTLSSAQIKEKMIKLQAEMRRQPSFLDQLKRDMQRYESMLYDFKSQKTVLSRKNYSRIEQEYLNASEIVLTTLASSGNDKL